MAERQITDFFWNRIIGQQRIRTLLADNLRNNRAAHAYLLSGNQGIGKLAVALEFAALLLCEESSTKPCGTCLQCQLTSRLQHPDLHIILPLPATKAGKKKSDDGGDEEEDPANQLGDRIAKLMDTLSKDPYSSVEIPKGKESKDDDSDDDSDSGKTRGRKSVADKAGKGKTRANSIRVPQIRTILRLASRKPFQSLRKVFVIVYADTMNENAQNALLKVLEEPASEAYFLLVTESERELKATIRSRCQRLPMPALSKEDILSFLVSDTVKAENADTLAAFANGNLVHAREMIGHDLPALQARVIDFLGTASMCNPIDLPKAIESLMDFDNLPDGAGLEMLEVFLRDAAVIQSINETSRMPQSLVFGGFRDRIVRLLTAFPQADFTATVKAVEEARSRLNDGYTRDQVLIVMAIKLSDALGPRLAAKSKKKDA